MVGLYLVDAWRAGLAVGTIGSPWEVVNLSISLFLVDLFKFIRSIFGKQLCG